MNWNEHPRIHGVTRRQLQQKWSYPAAAAALMGLCSPRATDSALSALQRPGNSKNAAFAEHNSIFVALGEMLKWEGSADQREAAVLGEEAPRWHPWLMRGPPTQREAPNRCGLLHSARAPPRNVHHAKRHESNGRTGAACPTFQLLGTPCGSSEVDGKAPASLPAHSPHTAPRLLRRSPLKCPKVENASQRAGNRTRNPARCPLEVLGGDASPSQRSPSAQADGRTPA